MSGNELTRILSFPRHLLFNARRVLSETLGGWVGVTCFKKPLPYFRPKWRFSLPYFRPDPKIDTQSQTRFNPGTSSVCLKITHKELEFPTFLNRTCQGVHNNDKSCFCQTLLSRSARVHKPYPTLDQNGSKTTPSEPHIPIQLM